MDNGYGSGTARPSASTCFDNAKLINFRYSLTPDSNEAGVMGFLESLVKLRPQKTSMDCVHYIYISSWLLFTTDIKDHYYRHLINNFYVTYYH